jgi:AraC family transcriptional regulator
MAQTYTDFTISRDPSLRREPLPVGLAAASNCQRQNCGVASRRISVDGAGHRMPVVPSAPGLSSATQNWEGFLVEHHVTNGLELPEHHHPAILLAMQMDAHLGGGWRSEDPQGATFIDAGTLTLHGRSSCKPGVWDGVYNRLLFELDPALIERLTEGRLAGGTIEIDNRSNFKDSRLESLLKVLHDELRLGAPTGRIFAEQVGNAVAMLLASQYAKVAPGMYGSGGRLSVPCLKRVFEYVEAHLHKDIHLSDLAKTAGMSAFYFARLFKKTTGKGPHEFLLGRRIERAKKMLRNSEISVFEIGMHVGYYDRKHFRTVFRREVGASPSEFRAAYL